MDNDTHSEGEIPLLRLIPLTNRIADVEKWAKKYDLSKSQLTVLVILHSRKLLNMSAIAEYLSSSKEQATRAVAPLVDRGLVARVAHPDNRKNVFIEFTDHGRELMEKIRHDARGHIETCLKNKLTEEEYAEFVRSLGTVISLLGKIE